MTDRILPSLVFFPQRKVPRQSLSQRMESFMSAWPVRLCLRLASARFARTVMAFEDGISQHPEASFGQRMATVREDIRRHGIDSDHVAESFAFLREMVFRQHEYRLVEEQIRAGYGLLKGSLVELEGGEGKAETIAVAAVLAAWAGYQVHLVAADDLQAQRSADRDSNLFEACGLSHSVIVHELPADQRRKAYAADVVHVCAREIAFDYLRDSILLREAPRNIALKLRRMRNNNDTSSALMLRGLVFAIVDDADNVLLDEARAPFVMSRQTEPRDERRWAEQTMHLIDSLDEGSDFVIDRERKRVELTGEGKLRLEKLVKGWGGLWESSLRSAESVRSGLVAQHLLLPDKHYVVRNGGIRMIDQRSGEHVADRSWGEGLQQLLEIKEGCEITGRRLPVAAISYPRLFQRYQHLAGIASVYHEGREEYRHLYRLPVLRLKSNWQRQTRRLPPRCFSSQESKWNAIVARAAETSRAGRTILIILSSAGDARMLAERLEKADLSPELILGGNPEQAASAEAARSPGQVAVVTETALLRGYLGSTDYIDAAGGTCIIHDVGCGSRRIDRKVEMQASRREFQGMIEKYCSLEDPLFKNLPRWMLGTAGFFMSDLPRSLGRYLMHHAQRNQALLYANIRRSLFKRDQQLDVFHSYSAGNE